VADIDQALIALRRDREILLTRLRQLEQIVPQSSNPTDFLDLAETRFELNCLTENLRGLMARTFADLALPPLGSETPRFADRVGGDSWCCARALVPLTPDSLLFVHGPVTVWHAAALAETLLDANERLISLAKCAFHNELTFEPKIIVWDDRMGRPPQDFARDDVAASGAFLTDHGRSFSFAAVPDADHVPMNRAGWHPMTRALIASGQTGRREAEPESIRQQLDPGLWPEAAAVVRPSDVLLAKAETFLAATTQNMVVGDRLMLLVRGTNFTLDKSFGAWLGSKPELQFEFDWARQKPIPGRGSFVPFRYRILPADPAWQRSMFVCLDSHLGL
jgi:hypothetical protein